MSSNITRSPDTKVVKLTSETKFWGFLKTFIVVGIILVQVAILVMFYLWLVDVFYGYLL